jgi:protein-S-isoprenylcysteine O-methyltransferase Ste14
MDDELLFKILFIVIYATFSGVRIYYRSQNLGREVEKEHTKMAKAFVVLSLAIIGYFLSIFFWIVNPSAIQVFQIQLPIFIRWFGAGISIIAIVLTAWIHHTLGKQYSARLEIQTDHQLITIGPYSKIRHPMYATLNLFSISISLVTSNLLLIGLAVCVAIPFHWITKFEEQLLIEQFGVEYLEYMKRTKRFLPL